MIEVKNVYKSFDDLEVLKGINLSIDKGEIVSIMGASGAGKSTLLHLIGTLDAPNSGEIIINEVNTRKMRGKGLAQFRNKNIGFIFQFHHLLPEFSALENVSLPALIAGKSQMEAEQKARDLLKFLGLKERLTHQPNELSGGEQQRVAVARALINNPAIVLADEPSGNLDSKNSDELHNLFFSLRDEFDQTFLIATHNKHLAQLADRMHTIQDGIINATAD